MREPMSVPTIVPRLKMVGTAQARLCPPYGMDVELNDSNFVRQSTNPLFAELFRTRAGLDEVVWGSTALLGLRGG
jgi:hypothetical protein